MKVWCVLEVDSYDARHIVGVCSTKDRADLVVEGMKRYSCGIEEYKIVEVTVDAILDYVKEQVDEELNAYIECEAFLERMKEFEEPE